MLNVFTATVNRKGNEMKTVELTTAIEFQTKTSALDSAVRDGRRVIMIAGRVFSVTKAEADRLERDGVRFAYVSRVFNRGGIKTVVTVPVN